MKLTKSILVIFIFIIAVSAASYAQDKDMMKKNMDKNEMMKKDKIMHKDTMMKIDKNMDGFAIKGFDPVSYFTNRKPEMGMTKFKFEWMGANWQFTNKEHMDMFMKDPEKYAPQFGGYCAFAASKNKLVHSDPSVWTIENGRLYLNVNSGAQKLFRKDLKKNIMMAEKNWPTLEMQK